jgi:hypothetical protein
MFEITEAKTVTLNSVTNRSENHGENEKVPAVSLGVMLETDNFFLDTLLPGLRERLYEPVGGDKQKPLDGVAVRTPKLRLVGVANVKLDSQFNGWTLHVDHGINESEPITLGGCKVDNFLVTPKQDSIVDVSFRIGSSDVDAHRLGLLGVKVGQKISIRLIAPEAVKELADDKAVKKARRQQKAAEEAGQGRIDGQPAGQASKDALDVTGSNPFPAGGGKTDDQVRAEALANGTPAVKRGKAATAGVE